MNLTVPKTKLSQSISTDGTFTKCHKILDSIGEINFSNIRNLSEDKIDFLTKHTPKRLRELAEINCLAAELIKNNLDISFGENNYTVITIGRSLSSIAELMRQAGIDTKQIPISGLRHFDLYQNKIPESALNILKKYLDSIGLTREKLTQNKNRKYILTDYTFFGRSLTAAYEILKQDNLLGNQENFIIQNAEQIIGKNYHIQGFSKLFSYNRFKDYSSVSKLPFEQLEKIFSRSNQNEIEEFNHNINKGVRKLFWFNIYDSIIKGSYKNIFPRNELNAIYNHYESLKAIRNYINRQNKMIYNP